ncbi:MAG: SDR family NAD(P)-dependent oxidoreductase [bacterium]
MTKKVYITGADRGLGFALVKEFLKRDYIVFAGRYLKDWQWLGDLKAKYPDRLNIVDLDISDDESIGKAKKNLVNNISSLDVLINNAGIYFDNADDIFGDLNFEIMEKMYKINSLGTLKVTHSVIDLLLNGKEKLLVNISSEAGSIENCWRKKEYGYSMSKTAVNMQSAILQNHLKEYGIKVFAIHPGYMKSYMLGEKNMDADIEPEESAEKIYKLIFSKKNNFNHIYYDYLGNELPW